MKAIAKRYVLQANAINNYNYNIQSYVTKVLVIFIFSEVMCLLHMHFNVITVRL